MKVCVVGGTGNISTSIVARLLEIGHDVTCFNRGQSAGVPEGVHVIHGDRNNPEQFEGRLRERSFDAAIDMRCFTADHAKSALRAFPHVGQLIHCSTVCTYGVEYDWFPTTEEHPLRPISDYGRGKVAADAVLMEAYYGRAYPVTIIKPSTTYGPKMGLLRQIGGDFGWLDRIRKGKAIVIAGDGSTMHQFLHVDDAALAFAHAVGNARCIGRTYNLVREGFTRWDEHHRTAMSVLGREVELVGVPSADLIQLATPGVSILRDIFAHASYYDAGKLRRDVPEFRPRVSLAEGMGRVIEALDRSERIPNSDETDWEDRVISAQRGVRQTTLS